MQIFTTLKTESWDHYLNIQSLLSTLFGLYKFLIEKVFIFHHLREWYQNINLFFVLKFPFHQSFSRAIKITHSSYVYYKECVLHVYRFQRERGMGVGGYKGEREKEWEGEKCRQTDCQRRRVHERACFGTPLTCSQVLRFPSVVPERYRRQYAERHSPGSGVGHDVRVLHHGLQRAGPVALLAAFLCLHIVGCVACWVFASVLEMGVNLRGMVVQHVRLA